MSKSFLGTEPEGKFREEQKGKDRKTGRGRRRGGREEEEGGMEGETD